MQETIFIRTPSDRRTTYDSVRTAHKAFQKLQLCETGRYGIWTELSDEDFDAQLRVVEVSKYPAGKVGLTFLEQRKEIRRSVLPDDIKLYVADVCRKAKERVATVSVSQSGDTLMYPNCPTGLEVVLGTESGSTILGFHVFWEVAQGRGRRIFLHLPPVDDTSAYITYPKCIVPSLSDALFFVQALSEVARAPISYF